MAEENKQKNKQMKLMIIGIAILVIGLVGITYAFFNYTRTGLVNNIGTGRIYFYSNQGNSLNLTNLFPIASSEVDNANLDSITINIVGDTTYSDGEEFLVSIVDVNNTITSGSTEKVIPINYVATYEATPVATGEEANVIGSSSNDYWSARESKNANVYLLNETGKVKEGKQVLVGYIKADNKGINGTLTIKAYLDGSNIAISDTYPNEDVTHVETSGETSVEVVDYTNGTTSEWVNGRVVFTTEEWNSLQNTPISFKIRAESNEGIWVEEPSKGIESCPDCKFMYYVVDFNDIATAKWTTWNNQNQTPTQITSGLYDNYEELIEATGKNYFLGVKLNSNNEVTNAYACGVKDNEPFCLEGTSDGSKYSANQTLLQGANLYNNSCTVILASETGAPDDSTECGPWDNSGSLSAGAGSDGAVLAGVGYGDLCDVGPGGLFVCVESEAVEPAPGGGGVSP